MKRVFASGVKTVTGPTGVWIDVDNVDPSCRAFNLMMYNETYFGLHTRINHHASVYTGYQLDTFTQGCEYYESSYTLLLDAATLAATFTAPPSLSQQALM